MRAAQAGDTLTVRGEVVRLARQVAYLETAIHSADGEPVSTGTGTFFVRRKEDRPDKEVAS
jgi:acyl-coenzyme A thioesterase PaaI-like protein